MNDDETTSETQRTRETGLAGARLTRRELLATTAAAASALALAACAPFPDLGAKPTGATPFTLGRPATLGVDATVPSALQEPALQRLKNAPGVPGASASNAAPDFWLTYGPAPAGYTAVDIGASPLAVLTHMRIPVDNITADQARKLLSGAATNWNQVGAPYSLPVRVFAVKGFPLPAGVTLASGAKTLVSLDEMVAAMRAQMGSVGVVPAEVAEWRLRNLGVDNVFPLQGRGDLSKATLPALTLRLAIKQELVSKGLDGRGVANALKPLLASAATVVDMVSAGDIMLGRGVNNKMVTYKDYRYPYRGIYDELQQADFRVANLECTVTDAYPVPTDPATFTFVSAAKAVDGLTYAGFHTLTVANNHSNGPGHAPFMDMLRLLRENKITVMGGGENLAEAKTPSVLSFKGTRIAMLGYHDFAVVPAQGPAAKDNSWGLAPLNLDTLAQDIADARAKADIVIPYFHWGIEYHKVPTRDQQNAARAAIDAGADMVLGNHPHWTQGVEEYKGKLIIYSMGNFVFDQDWSRETMEGMLIHYYWRGPTLASVRFVPTLDKDRCQPNVMTQAEAVGVFQRMWSATDILATGQYGIA